MGRPGIAKCGMARPGIAKCGMARPGIARCGMDFWHMEVEELCYKNNPLIWHIPIGMCIFVGITNFGICNFGILILT